MFEVWYTIVAFMLTTYVVLDGFDLGVGTLHLYVARTETERRQVLAAIGPFWDGNEVWLLTAGGALLVAFPRVLAAGISGFYFAIFLVVWCLILRGVAIEFRSHVADGVWRASWDFFFAVASALLPVFLGAALGNLLRGVPLGPDGWFELPLFTNFMTQEPVGILDWYTALVGIFALMTLAGHGATYLAWKTDGGVRARSRLAGFLLYAVAAALWLIVTRATWSVDPGLFVTLSGRPLTWGLAAIAIAGLAVVFVGLIRGPDVIPFLGSCAFVGGLSGATAAAVFPVLLRATGGASLSLTIYTAGGDPEGLRKGLGWFAIGFPLALLYAFLVFHRHRGKTVAAPEGEGY